MGWHHSNKPNYRDNAGKMRIIYKQQANKNTQKRNNKKSI